MKTREKAHWKVVYALRLENEDVAAIAKMAKDLDLPERTVARMLLRAGMRAVEKDAAALVCKSLDSKRV